MPYETVNTKKFLDSVGVGHLWDKIRDHYDSKLDSVVATDDSVKVTGANSVKVQISNDPDNALTLKTTGNTKGLFVSASASGVNDTYAIVRASNSGEYAAIYQLMRYIDGSETGSKVGVDINIPKDMVVQSGTVEVKSTSGAWGNAGTYLHLVLANADNDDIYINVSNLIEYVTSGSQSGDMVVINIDQQHHVTATITDNSITASKLTSELRTQISAGATAVHEVVEGSANGSITVDGTNVFVHGLGSAAYTSANAYDVAGSAAAVLGTELDADNAATIYGVKLYASNIYAAVQSLTNSEIDAAIADANTP